MARSMNRMYDAGTLLKDAGLVAASAAAQVAAAAQVLDLAGDSGSIAGFNQPEQPFMECELVIDVTAIEIASNDEKYVIHFQGSTSPTFASSIANLASLELSAAAVAAGGGTVAGAIGRYLMAVRNERNGTIYRYVRLYTTATGTIATGINYTARLSKMLKG